MFLHWHFAGRLKTRRRAARPLTIIGKWTGDRTGAIAAEFALVLPLLAALFFAIVKFGIMFNNYIELTNGVGAGARQLSISRGSATPYTSTKSAVAAAAPNLSSSSLTVTLSSSGSGCASDSACTLTAGGQATVSATYPCNINVLWITFPNCTLTSSSTELVE